MVAGSRAGWLPLCQACRTVCVWWLPWEVWAVVVGSTCPPLCIHAVCRRWQSNGKNRWGLGSRGAYRHVLIRSDSRSRLLPGRVGMLGLLYYNQRQMQQHQGGGRAPGLGRVCGIDTLMEMVLDMPT